MRHVIVYREQGRFAGWPANGGMWAWGNEMLVGFHLGLLRPGSGFHAIESGTSVQVQARSMDGGETWQLEEQVLPQGTPTSPAEPIRFDHPDLALNVKRSGTHGGARAWFYSSYDRGRTWSGPFAIPMFDLPGVPARTDYVVYGPERCLFFFTAAKTDGREGRVFCAESADGGRSFQFVSWIGPEPEGFAIMPAGVRLASGRLLVAVRCKGGGSFETARHWIDLYASHNEGRTWQYVGQPVECTGMGGNPGTLTELMDGRILLTYGYRDMPAGMRAKLSSDGGLTWGEEIVMRDDAGNHDLGYPRAVRRPDGTVVVTYYFNDHPDGERYIAATLWKP